MSVSTVMGYLNRFTSISGRPSGVEPPRVLTGKGFGSESTIRNALTARLKFVLKTHWVNLTLGHSDNVKSVDNPTNYCHICFLKLTSFVVFHRKMAKALEEKGSLGTPKENITELFEFFPAPPPRQMSQI